MRIIFFILIFFLTIRTNSQDLSDSVTIEDIYEKLLESQTEDAEDSHLLDKLNYLIHNPLDINAADRAQLEQIPFVTPVLAHRILVYRLKNKFNSISEILKLEGIDLELYNILKKFLFVKPILINRKVFTPEIYKISLRDRFINELQPSKGFTNDSIYPGSRPKLYNRLNASLNSSIGTFNLAIVQEKDAGEQKFFDHIGGFLEYRSDTFINHFIAGDYNLEFGQGITLWSPLALSKGNDAVTSVSRNGGEIDSYMSVNEVQFFRGGAAKFKIDLPVFNVNLFGFYSDNYFDASIDTTLDELSTIYYDGNHRTIAEQKRKNAAKEKMFGGRLEFEKNTSVFGVTYYNSRFDKSFKQDNLFEFYGNRANAIGADYNFVLYNTNFFGEWARSYTGAIGGVSGLSSAFFEKNKYSLEAAVIFRYYPEDFIMLHSNGFGEKSGDTKNEIGIYTGLKFKIPGLLSLNAYFDQYKFPYRSFFIPVPVSGSDFLAYAELKLSRELILTAKYKSESKEDIIKHIDEYNIERNVIYTGARNNYRIQFDYQLSKVLRVRSRFEYVFVDYESYKSSQKGLLFYTDLNVKPYTALSLSSRFIVFQTDSYDSRIYEYENELEGVVSNNGLYGKGRRWYIMLKYRLLDKIQLSAKYSETIMDGVRSIGSGYDEIKGDLKNRLSFQLDLMF